MAFRVKELDNQELSSFCRQMAMILKAGVSPIEGVAIMNESPASAEDAKILSQLESQLAETGSFTAAVQTMPVFPVYFISMIDIGEQAGQLDDVMEALADHYAREAEIALAVKRAVTYPFVMITMMMAVVLVVVMKVLPVFNQAFSQMGSQISGFSKAVLDFGLALNNHSLPIIIVFSSLIILLGLCANTQRGRRLCMQAAGLLHIGSRLTQAAAFGRIASGLSIVVSSGLNPEKSMELIASLLEEPEYAQRVKRCQQALEEGVDFGEALKKTDIFSGVYVRMAAVGFRTGNLDSAMKKIAQNYEEELDTRIGRIISMLEPTLIAVLSVVIGVVLLAVMLPLLGVMAGF